MANTIYVYTQCIGHEIFEPMFFSTLEQAHSKMIHDFKDMIDQDQVADIEEAYGKPISQLDSIDEYNCGLNEISAWTSDCGFGRYWNAKIHAINIDSLFDISVRIKSDRI